MTVMALHCSKLIRVMNVHVAYPATWTSVCGRHGEALSAVGAMVALHAERERVVDVITLVAVVPLFEAVGISSRCNALSRNC